MEQEQLAMEQVYSLKKLLVENMKLKKELYKTKHELETLKRFVGGE